MKNEITQLKSIRKIDSNSKRYDIEVEKNHNFFANNILVHNSLGIMFNYDGKWMVATAGSFASEQAIWATNWVRENLALYLANENYTYLFEIVYPENKIVVNYDFSGLVLLGIVKNSGREVVNHAELRLCADKLRSMVSVEYNFADMKAIVRNAKELGANEEGYVVRFSNGVRLKVKSDEYVRIHKLVSRVTPLAIWECLLAGEDLSELKKELPEEMTKDFDVIISILTTNLSEFVAEVEDMDRKTAHMSPKELGLYLKTKPKEFENRKFSTSINYIFAMRNGKFHKSMADFSSMQRRSVFRAFKPKANMLPGYVPSSVVTRFADGI